MTDKPQNSNKNYVPRITQLDSSEFDYEIHNVLSSELLKKNATFGQELLSLKYKESLTKKHAIVFVLVNYMLPYLKNKFEDNSSRIQSNTIKNVCFKIELFVKFCNFLNLLIFIREGKYPTVADRLLKLTYSPVTKLNRNIGYNYLTRELLWHGFMELIMYILPLINFKAMKRKLRKAFLYKTHHTMTEKRITLNTKTKCVICDDYPTLPCLISEYCPHPACYYCIKSNILADDKFICPVCGENNTASDHLKFLYG